MCIRDRGYTVNSISADTFLKWIPKDGPCFSSVCSSDYPLGVPSLRRIVLTVEGNSNINKTTAFTYLERIEGKLFPDMKVMIVFVSHNTCLTSSEVAVMCCPWHWLRYAQFEVSVTRIATAKIKKQVVTAFTIAHAMRWVSVAFQGHDCMSSAFAGYLCKTKIKHWVKTSRFLLNEEQSFFLYPSRITHWEENCHACD